MRRITWSPAVGLSLMLLTAQAVAAQPAPPLGPPLAEVEATWTAFWNHMTLGDLDGALKYIHSSRRHLFPTTADVRKMQELAQQMAFCRIDPVPFPIGKDELIYPVHCRHGDETAETQIGIRRDFDGVWRLSLTGA